MNPGRTLRTLRPLRWSQLAARARIALCGRRRVPLPAREPAIAGEFPALPEADAVDVSGLAEGRFRHLNFERALGIDPVAWPLGDPGQERLWVVTLHYHEWAPALASERPELLELLLRDWIRRCAPECAGALPLAWNSYAIATRIPNWIRAWQRGAIGAGFKSEFLRSLWRQAAFLAANLEWDLRANHLLRDAVGLAWAGRFFAHTAWQRTACDLAASQAQEQLLPDGLHFELSPMYHDHALRDFEQLAVLLPEALELPAAVRRMRAAVPWLRHPDGGIALLNDASLAPHPPHAQPAPRLEAAENSSPFFYFRDQLVCWRGDPWCLFFDVGAIGPDCQPGHAHADSLSLEASFGGARLFVDPGTYGYDQDERRRYDRSTGSHNTVCVDGQDSSEVWQIFRVGRRARPLDPRASFGAGALSASGSHDGYDHLPGKPRHSRAVELQGARLCVRDRVGGGGRHRVEGGWLLAPELCVAAAAGGFRLETRFDRLRVRVEGPPELALSVETRNYHPEFGRELETRRLGWRFEGRLPLEVRTWVEPA